MTATVSAEASTLSARLYTHQDTTPDTGRMASSACAAACAAARYVPTAGSSKSSRFAGNKAPFTARSSRVAARRAAMGAQAVVSPPQTHDNARPDTTRRPVSAAAVDSNKALEQFRSMGGASRKFSPRSHISPHFSFSRIFFFFFPFFFFPGSSTATPATGNRVARRVGGAMRFARV